MFLKLNTVTLFHPDGCERRKKYSTLCSGLCTWPKRKIFKSVMHYKAGDITWEPNFLDGSTGNNRVLTAFEFKGCFSHSCVKCYHGNDWPPLAWRGHLWTTWREQELIPTLWGHRIGLLGQSQVGASAVLSWEQTLLIPAGALWAVGHLPLVCMIEQPLMRKYITMILLIVVASSTKHYPLGHPKVISESSDTLTAYFGLVKANTTVSSVKELNELYGCLFSLTYAVSSCINKDGPPHITEACQKRCDPEPQR